MIYFDFCYVAVQRNLFSQLSTNSHYPGNKRRSYFVIFTKLNSASRYNTLFLFSIFPWKIFFYLWLAKCKYSFWTNVWISLNVAFRICMCCLEGEWATQWRWFAAITSSTFYHASSPSWDMPKVRKRREKGTHLKDFCTAQGLV